MQKRKLFGLLFISLLVLTVSLSFVSAQNFADDASDFVGDILDFITTGVLEPVFEFLLGDYATSGDFLVKSLLIVLTITVIMAVLEAVDFFKGKKGTKFIVSAIISVLGVRFIPDGFVSQIVTPSTALVAAIGLGLPFVIFFYVLEKFDSPNIRRAGWAIFGVLILVLWAENLGNPDIPATAKWLYLLFVGGCAVAFWWDGTLHRWFTSTRVKARLSASTQRRISMVEAQISGLQEDLTDAETVEQRKAIREKIEAKKAVLDTLNE